MKSYVKYLPLSILGAGIGFFMFMLLPYAPLSVTNPMLIVLGIQKPRIIAFLPYFLAYKETNNYNSSITTLDYFGLTIDSDGHIIKLTNPQQEDPGWHDLRTQSIQKRLQDAKNNHITLSLSVVAQDEASISALIADPKNHAQNLLHDIIPVMKTYDFSDLNIDVESFQKHDSKDIQAFTSFVQVLKNGLEKGHVGTVTVDVSPIAFAKTNLIDPVAIGKAADYILVMAYDYNNVISPNTGPIAPLGGVNTVREYDVSTAIAIAKREIDPQKIILGIPFYGYEWDSLSSTPAAATIPNTGMTASNKRIITTFSNSCATCTIMQDPVAQEADYIYQDNKGDPYYHQAFLLDTTALAKRLSFSLTNHLGGVAVWALGYESNTLLPPLAIYKQTFQYK